MTDDKTQTYDFICFTDLAYEFDVCEKKEIEKKIKRRLKYHDLGDYNQGRVDYIRQLKKLNNFQNPPESLFISNHCQILQRSKDKQLNFIF